MNDFARHGAVVLRRKWSAIGTCRRCGVFRIDRSAADSADDVGLARGHAIMDIAGSSAGKWRDVSTNDADGHDDESSDERELHREFDFWHRWSHFMHDFSRNPSGYFRPHCVEPNRKIPGADGGPWHGDCRFSLRLSRESGISLLSRQHDCRRSSKSLTGHHYEMVLFKKRHPAWPSRAG